MSEYMPGRVGEIRGVAISNARRTRDSGRDVYPRVYVPGDWGVRFGSRFYPDYAEPHPTAWDGSHGGQFLTPDEADELAEHLISCAVWARAQQILEPNE